MVLLTRSGPTVQQNNKSATSTTKIPSGFLTSPSPLIKSKVWSEAALWEEFVPRVLLLRKLGEISLIPDQWPTLTTRQVFLASFPIRLVAAGNYLDQIRVRIKHFLAEPSRQHYVARYMVVTILQSSISPLKKFPSWRNGGWSQDY